MKQPFSVAIYSGVSKSTVFIERLIAGLANQKVDVYIFGSYNGQSQTFKNVKYKTYKGKWLKGFFLFKYSLLLKVFKAKDKRRLDAFIKTQKKSNHILKLKYYPVLYYQPKIFHLQWAKSIYEWDWVQDFGMELVISLRGTHITISPITQDYWKNEYLENFPKIKSFHAVSNDMISKATPYGANENNIKVIKSGLPLESFEFNLKKKIKTPLKVISIGRSHFTKGYKHALDAMKILTEKKVSFEYAIIGIEQDEALLHQRSQLELEQHISYLPFMSYKDVKRTISEADVLLLSSVEEGIANVVLEAMALGTLVISTDCGGMKEVINHNETGLLVPIRNPEAIADAIESVVGMPLMQYQKMTTKARSLIETKHSEKGLIKNMLNLYNNVIP